MLRVINEVRPRVVLGENVTGIVELALEQVLTDLESKNYSVEPPIIIPSVATGGQTIRERVWIIANTNIESEFSKRLAYSEADCERESSSKIRSQIRDGFSLVTKGVAPTEFSYSGSGGRQVTEPLLCGVTDGISGELHQHRLTALGNAIDPHVAFEIFKAIEATEA